MKEQEPTIGRSVHVRTEGGCLAGIVAVVASEDVLVVSVFTGAKLPEPPVKNVTVGYGSTTGWHWYQECPDNPPKKAVEKKA